MAGVYGKIGGMASRSELSIHHIIALLLRSVLKRLPDCAGVQKLKSGTFNMYGGSISGNSAQYDGGVWLEKEGNGIEFNMYGGDIGKEAAKVITPPTAVELVYNGLSQCLAPVGGEASGGTLVYGYVENGEYFETTDLRGINAGKYELWYKVQGDSNHSDTAPVKLTAIIKPKTLTKDDLTYSGPITKVYDTNNNARLNNEGFMQPIEIDKVRLRRISAETDLAVDPISFAIWEKDALR